uniref:Uncharacterized protein n=1 Tax=viral metagenome TaxID=1070528 RepID=A0A6C0JAE0_9ZZZZ
MDNSKLHNDIESYVELEVNRKLKLRLEDLSLTLIKQFPDEYKYIKELVKKYSYPVRTMLRLNIERKKRMKRELLQKHRCQARTGNNTQCRRPSGTLGQYCLSHQHTLPHGNINDPYIICDKCTGKRGRKKKNIGEFETSDLNSILYVQSLGITIEGISYLLDENHILYKYGDNVIVGYIENDIVIWT